MPQICVSMPALPAPDGPRLLTEALAAAAIVSIVLEPEGAGGTIRPDAALPLIASAQKAGAAVLILDDARLARTLKADGVHLSVRDDILAAAEEAREILGQGGIVGVDAGRSRHDAMEAGEQGVDYVAFGVPPDVNGDLSDERVERVAWWAEIFEIPVVAYGVSGRDEAIALARADADFISIRLTPDTGSVANLKDIAAAVASATPEAVA